MAETVTMRHPTLPGHQTIEVTRRAARHLGRSGWVEVEQTPASEPASAQAPEPVLPRRRRTTKEEE